MLPRLNTAHPGNRRCEPGLGPDAASQQLVLFLAIGPHQRGYCADVPEFPAQVHRSINMGSPFTSAACRSHKEKRLARGTSART